MKNEEKKPSLEVAVNEFSDTAKCVANVRLALVHGNNIAFGTNMFVVGVHYDMFSGEPFFEIYDQTHRGFSSIPVRVAVVSKSQPFYDELYNAVIGYVVPVNELEENV